MTENTLSTKLVPCPRLTMIKTQHLNSQEEEICMLYKCSLVGRFAGIATKTHTVCSAVCVAQLCISHYS